jgi:SAM-dependent methyltransferase
MDAHPYEWMKAEMADVWLGFERSQVREWFEAAGLVNIIVDCTGETCHAHSEIEQTSAEEAKVSVFVAAGTRRVPGVRSEVQANYSAAAQGNSSCCSQPATVEDASPSSCCSSSSCCGSNEDIIPLSQLDAAPGYTPSDMQQAPAEAAEISLGCGNPIALAGLKPGEAVLDIGSGGGLDSFLSAAKVGPTGKVIGVDMTPAMIERARHAAEKGGYPQVEFRLGQAEALPVEAETVDVVISNCVINLCEDKGKVFQEAGRVLKPGGRLEISDMVTDEPLPLDFSENPGNWAGCVYGALTEREYLDLIKQAGFQDFQLRRSPAAEIVPGVRIYSLNVSAKKG